MGVPLETQVIISGGGPVGMLLASELALVGIDVVVVERRAEPTDEPRAGTMHARTLQSLARRGFVPADDDGDPDAFKSAKYFFAGVPGLTMRSPATEPPPVLNIPQIELERMFETRARVNGATILRGHEVLHVVESDEGVLVSGEAVRDPSAKWSISGQYLVGADGARGIVRQSMGFQAEDHPPTIDGLIAKARLLEPATAPMAFQRTPRGWTRIDQHVDGGYSRLMTFGFEGPAPDRHAPPTFTEFQERFARIVGRPVPMADPLFLARFSDYARLVTEYRRGRVLLAGDAAHVHFPIAGQGLNLGIQDAFNLGWKLAAAMTRGEDSLLDTYHEERHPRARRVVMNTRAQVVLMCPTDDFAPLRELVGELLELEAAADHLAMMINGQDIAYPAPDGSCSGEFQPNFSLRSDHGATSIARLLEQGRPVLIAHDRFGSELADLADRWNSTIVAVHAAAAAALPWDCALIRPDGYLAWTGSLEHGERATVERVLRGWYGGPENAADSSERSRMWISS